MWKKIATRQAVNFHWNGVLGSDGYYD